MNKIFKKLWESWKRVARVIGVFQTRLFLSLFYYILLLPFGLIVRAFSDPLTLKFSAKKSAWINRTTRDKTIDDLRKQS